MIGLFGIGNKNKRGVTEVWFARFKVVWDWTGEFLLVIGVEVIFTESDIIKLVFDEELIILITFFQGSASLLVGSLYYYIAGDVITMVMFYQEMCKPKELFLATDRPVFFFYFLFKLAFVAFFPVGFASSTLAMWNMQRQTQRLVKMCEGECL